MWERWELANSTLVHGTGIKLAAIELGEYFPSLQVVSYTVSDETVVDVALDGDKLILSGKSAGNSVVTLSDGCALYKKFEITVR